MRTKFLLAGVVLGFGSLAMAVNFPSGGGIYYGNVACQSNDVGGYITSAAALFTGGASSGQDVNRVIDGMGQGTGNWTVTGLASIVAAASATAVIDMGKVWSISRIDTKYGNWGSTANLQYELAVSTDNSTWTPVVPATLIGSSGGRPENINTFAATNARYISWKVIGSGAPGTANSLGLSELQAYVPTGAAAVPQLEDGYNLVRGKTAAALIVNTFNSPGWFAPGGLFDGVWNNDGGLLPDAVVSPVQTAVIDLGASYKLARLTAQFYGSWPDGELAISNDNITWTIIKGPGSISDSTYTFAPQMGRYVRIIGVGDGSKLQEFDVFAAIPEPATLSLLALAGMGILARRRR